MEAARWVLWPFRRYFGGRRAHLKQRLLKGAAVCPACKLPLDKEKKRHSKDTCDHQKCKSCSYPVDSCEICTEKKDASLNVRLRRNDDRIQRRPKYQSLDVDNSCRLTGDDHVLELSKPDKKRLCRRKSCSSLENPDDIFSENLFSSSWEKRASNKSLESSMRSIGSRCSTAAIDLLVTDNYENRTEDKRYSSAGCSNFSLAYSTEHSEESKKKDRIASLRLKPLYFEVPQSDADSVLFPRNWILREIEKVLWSNEFRGVALTGGAGTGKTSLILQLVDHSSFGRKWEETLYQSTKNIYTKIDSIEKCALDDESIEVSLKAAGNLNNDPLLCHLASKVVAYHFCQAECDETCRVPDFVHGLAAQLCQAPQLIEYRNFLYKSESLQELLSLQSCIKKPHLALSRGILEPLLSLEEAPKTPVIILVDSLHEAEEIGAFLAENLERFPAWLKVIFSVRTVKKQILSFLPLSMVSLDDCSINVQNDVMQYMWYRMKINDAIRLNVTCRGKEDNDITSRFSKHVVGLSKGSFLYVKLILDLLERNHIVIKSESFGVVPVSLDQVFTLTFNLSFSSTAAFQQVKFILEVCLASSGPLTPTEIFYGLSAAHVEPRLAWPGLLRRLQALRAAQILFQRRDGSLMLGHPALREWLQEDQAAKFRCHVGHGHAALALLIMRLEHPFSNEQEVEFWPHLLNSDFTQTSASDTEHNLFPILWSQYSSVDPTSALVNHRNVYSPKVQIYRLLLQAGADANAFVESEKLPLLTLTSMLGFLEIVNLLLEFKADSNSKSGDGNAMTPLMAAASNGQLQVVKLLLSSNAKIELQDAAGRCALTYAAGAGHLKTVDFLANFAWPKNCFYSRYRAIHQALVAASKSGNIEVCGYLLNSAGASVNVNDASTSGHTPLTAACSSGHLDVCRLLLDKGVSIESCSCGIDDGEKTPLSWAAATGSLSILGLLLDAGADVNAKDANGLTALSWACIRNKTEVVEFLLEQEADVEAKDTRLRTPIMFAAMHGDASLVNVLLQNGADIEHASIDNTTSLDLAVTFSNFQAVTRFLHRGVKLSSKTWDNAQGHPKMILMLLHKLLSDGVVLYKKERFVDASYRFQYALKKCAVLINEEHFKIRQLRYHLLLGYSRCKRRLHEYAAAIDAATEASRLRPNCFEAFYLRARSRHESGQYTEAISDVTEALKLSYAEPYTKRMLQNLRAEILTSSKVVSPLDTAEDGTRS